MRSSLILCGLTLLCFAQMARAEEFSVKEADDEFTVASSTLEFTIRRKGYVTGVKAGSFLDKKTGFRDLGFGLDIVDWIMEPGSDEAYRDQLNPELVYKFGNEYHGNTP